jgi:hypothetical protein
VYGTGPGRSTCCAEVRTGDVVLMPHGYHGPSMAAPGYDLYYLNVMAGPGERAWRFTDDPATPGSATPGPARRSTRDCPDRPEEARPETDG